jgi:hypothetical protein
LRDEPTGRLSHSRWSETALVHKQTVNKRRASLLGAGLVEHTAVGNASYYRLTEGGKAVAEQC